MFGGGGLLPLGRVAAARGRRLKQRHRSPSREEIEDEKIWRDRDQLVSRKSNYLGHITLNSIMLHFIMGRLK